ncbi:antitoxin [Roseicella aquatilis]|uniref:AbrB/MazE/SpoVT family DNA-binding domain-containing protein n=1 Tax=Roseicella aquatilis TaxID=2527868 RepID=A0A4R4DLK8_9PROT|nr:AbrB/MazE/SpoVT family DNA-binding domain-containing protein [Roseicella aquatilis]TCZ60907.1 AbrB/MazE/SpoVT family DNA-binding domain-containing protein [Roseicella aquatilis]
MADYAKLFRNGGSQAVRLPREHRFPGDRVRVTKVPGGILLQPLYADLDEWFAAMDAAAGGVPFMDEGRQQPPVPAPPSFDEDDEESGPGRHP